MDPADIRHRFQFHPADAQNTKEQHEQVRAMHLDIAERLNEMLPDGREKSLAVTHLESSMMWSNAAIARADGPNE